MHMCGGDFCFVSQMKCVLDILYFGYFIKSMVSKLMKIEENVDASIDRREKLSQLEVVSAHEQWQLWSVFATFVDVDVHNLFEDLIPVDST